jgi:hypothetical protein
LSDAVVVAVGFDFGSDFDLKPDFSATFVSITKALFRTSARSLNKLTGRVGPVWQEESFDHVLRSSESFEEKLEYIRQNPTRRGLVNRPEDYRGCGWNPDPCGSDTIVLRRCC